MAVPNGQDDDRRGSGTGPLGRFAGSRLEWPRGNAWIAVAMTRVDASSPGGNNPPSDTPPTAVEAQPAAAVAPSGSTGSGSTVNPSGSTPNGSVPSVVSTSTVGPAPEITAGTPRARSASTRSADSG